MPKKKDENAFSPEQLSFAQALGTTLLSDVKWIHMFVAQRDEGRASVPWISPTESRQVIIVNGTVSSEIGQDVPLQTEIYSTCSPSTDTVKTPLGVLDEVITFGGISNISMLFLFRKGLEHATLDIRYIKGRQTVLLFRGHPTLELIERGYAGDDRPSYTIQMPTPSSPHPWMGVMAAYSMQDGILYIRNKSTSMIPLTPYAEDSPVLGRNVKFLMNEVSKLAITPNAILTSMATSTSKARLKDEELDDFLGASDDLRRHIIKMGGGASIEFKQFDRICETCHKEVNKPPPTFSDYLGAFVKWAGLER